MHHLDKNLVTGILFLLNQLPTDRRSKKQATVETATYGTQVVASRTASSKMWTWEVPAHKLTYMFEDIESTVGSTRTLQAKLHKGHKSTSYRVREAVVVEVAAYYSIKNTINPTEIRSRLCTLQ